MDHATEVLAEFENLCGSILLGKASEDDIKAITKKMCETGQSAYMAAEFKRIGSVSG